MKRVSFSVATALKEAGYPQEWYNDEYYYSASGELKRCDDYEGNNDEDIIFYQRNAIPAPFAMEVWLWLWREKKYAITLECIDNKDWATGKVGFFDDPEKAIIAEIQHIVDCKLLN